VSITIEMLDQEITEIKHLTQLENDAEAIIQAAREYLRLIRLRELKAASGRVEFDANWQELEDLELNESTLPQ
jgi:hypothetical protein